MIDKLLAAYEYAKKHKNESLIAWIKKIDLYTKIVLGCMLFFSLFLYVSCFISIKLVPYAFALYMMDIIGTCIFLKWYSQQDWENAIEKYNADLDILREVLCIQDFNLYNMKKIQQLIKKCQRDVKRLEKREQEIETKLKTLIGSYIIPLITFFVGHYLGNDKDPQIYVYALNTVIVLILGGIIGLYLISYIRIELLEGNILKRKTDLMDKLQDLLDRDFGDIK